MAREIGTFPISGNFEVQKAATFDARQSVDNFADLLNFTSANFIINAFPVSVKGVATPSERGLYICNDKDNLDLAASWIKLGDGLTIPEIVTGVEALTGSSRLDAASLKNLIAYIDALQGNANWRQTITANNGLIKSGNNIGLGGSLIQNTLINVNTRNFNLEAFNNTDTFKDFIFNANDFILRGRFINENTGQNFGQVDISIDPQNFSIFDGRGITASLKKIGLVYKNFGENSQGEGGSYPDFQGNSIVPLKVVQDITGLLTALNTTNKTSLVAAINEVLAGGGGSYTDAEARAAVAKFPTQIFRFTDITSTFEYTQAESFRINSIVEQTGVTSSIKLSDGTTDYVLGATVTAFDYLILSVDVIGSFKINAEII